ncbi:MAG: outer membrane beta-barrel protein [Bacteroidia bacterium]|nr:outer membrane beta-barrel protein [Bacteroidia bacterium]
MKKLSGMIPGILMAAVTLAYGQDSTKVKGFDFSKLKPIVHFFANAEYNPSTDVSKDYSFWIGRMMFGFQYQYDKHWSAKILIDRFRLTESMNTMYLKVANLRWTPDDRFAIEGGAISQNNFIPFETFWGYRFVAETFQDRYFGIPSTDLGFAAYYTINKMLSVDVAVTNGEGPRIDQDNFGKVKLAGGLNFYPADHIQTRAFYHLKSSGEPGYTAKEHLFNVYVGYRAGDQARFGAEFTYVNNNLGVPVYNTYGGTVFGCVALYKSLNFLVRYDRLIVENNSDIIVPYIDSQNALITGLSLSSVKGITLCLNYQGSYHTDQIKPTSHRILFSFEYKI